MTRVNNARSFLFGLEQFHAVATAIHSSGRHPWENEPRKSWFRLKTSPRAVMAAARFFLLRRRQGSFKPAKLRENKLKCPFPGTTCITINMGYGTAPAGTGIPWNRWPQGPFWQRQAWKPDDPTPDYCVDWIA
jgi:hypothetical protein